MQFMLDHIAAALVYMTVAFLIAFTQIRATSETIEQTIAYASKKQILELADLLEQELALIGEGMPPNQQITNVVTNTQGETTSFIFWRNDGIDDLLIEYRLVFVDSVTVGQDTFALYRMDRYVNSVLDGGSQATLKNFRLDPLNASGNIVSPDAAKLVRATVVSTYPLGDLDDMYIGQTHWGITIQPMNLN